MGPLSTKDIQIKRGEVSIFSSEKLDTWNENVQTLGTYMSKIYENMKMSYMDSLILEAVHGLF